MPTSISESSDQDLIGELYFVEESVFQVLEILGRLKNRRVLTTENMPNPRLSFDSKGEMRVEDAVVALESLLSMNGIAVSEMGEMFLRAFPANSIRKRSPELLNQSTLMMTPSEKVYSKIFEMRYLTTEKMESLLRNTISDGVGHLDFVPAERTFVVTDTLSNLQRIELMLRKLDKPADKEMVVHRLRYVDAKSAGEKLKVAIETTLGGFVEGNVAITIDEHSNQLIVVSNAESVKLIGEMIEMMDVDTYPFTRSEIFRLQYAAATEIVGLINDLVDAGNSNQTNTISIDNEESSQRKQQFSRFLNLVAEERSNAILAKGTESDLESVAKLISKIDVHLAQVKIDVVIAEVTLSNEHSRGVEKFGIAYDENDEISFSINEGSGLGFSAEGILSDLVFQGLTLREFTLATVFDTAKKDSDVNVISSPTLVTMHNKEAFINAGESRPVITSTNTDSTGLNTRSQVQFKDIGIRLKVKPLIGSNGMVQLEIEQSVESVVDNVVIDGNSQPVIGKREATSYVSVADGQMIVLGGLQEHSLRNAGARLSLLGSIPFLGKWLFSSKRNNELNRELIIFLKPTVFHGILDASEYSKSFWNSGVSKLSGNSILDDFEKTSAFPTELKGEGK